MTPPDRLTIPAEPQGTAPGAPGIAPTWSSSDKDLVGTAAEGSRLWFTCGHGIVNEVYGPRIDIPQTRDLGFIVGDGAGFWVEVKRLTDRQLRLVRPGVPAPVIVHRHPRFTLQLRICSDVEREVLLIEVVLSGDESLRPYVLLAPHLGSTGLHNRAAVARHGARRVLWAEQGPFGLALLACDENGSDAFAQASAGYVGHSDGWQDFARHGAMTWAYAEAGPGNVALTGALRSRHAVLALGLASSPVAAATLAASALAAPFAKRLDAYVRGWRDWRRRGLSPHRKAPSAAGLTPAVKREFAVSALVLRSHLDRTYPGAAVASLSIPWGSSSDSPGGYHLVWPRDLVECAGALLALGDHHACRNTLAYLIATQQADGRWYQNQWLGGRAYWAGIQLDETALPVLLATSLAERDALHGLHAAPMAAAALRHLALNGPSSPQDRWEENAGLNAFTLATLIAALVAGSRFVDAASARVLLALADYWNSRIEDWTVARGTPLAQRHGVAAYYTRIAPPQVLWQGPAALQQVLPIKNHRQDLGQRADETVGVDFLQLVRFGLRAPDDPLVRDTLLLADALLRRDTPSGPVWRRYLGDGYGEHADGRPFDGSGIGRGWPLLTGERGHYELAAGRDPLPHLEAMTRMASPLGLLPEQVWDEPQPIPERFLFPGRPTGGAMPLAWAHAEFIKLVLSRQFGRVLDQPPAVAARYQGRRPEAALACWSEAAPITQIARGQGLLVLLPRPARLHWGHDGWQDVCEQDSRALPIGLHVVEIEPAALTHATRLDFTWRWQDEGSWRGVDYAMALA